jgi:hypothetical protein
MLLVGPLPEDRSNKDKWKRPLADLWNLESEMGNRPKNHRTITPFTALVLFCLCIIVIMVFFPAVDFFTTNPGARWVIFVALVSLLAVALLRTVMPRTTPAPPPLSEPPSEKAEEGPVERNLNLVKQALEGSQFSEMTLYNDLKDAFVRRIMLRRHLSRAQVERVLADPDAVRNLIRDDEVASFLIDDLKAEYSYLQQGQMPVVGLQEEFYSRFSRLLRKLEMFQ